MANTDKNILITPNIGQTADPTIVFSGADSTTAAQNITLAVYPTSNGTLSFEGSAGQLFSITNSLTGTIFSVNDISGIPSIEVLDSGVVKVAEYSGSVLLGTNTDNGTDKLQIAGSLYATGELKGTATSAKYADLAEKYTSDADYEPGTVLVFGGDAEVTISTRSHDTAVAGVVSTDPAYLMNSAESGVSVALTGKVPCKVQGPVHKGQLLVTGHHPGVAHALDDSAYRPGCVIGKALENHDTDTLKVIQIAVGRF